MFRIGALNNRRKQGTDAIRGRLRLRPSLMALEDRELLSIFTGNYPGHHANPDALRPAAGTPALAHVSGAHEVTDARRGHPRRATTGPILSQTFNASGFPSGWQTFLTGSVTQSATNFLTITTTTEMTAGIIATPSKTVPFNPVGVKTTIMAKIHSVSSSPLGNAIFGLISPSGAELAAGIDAQGTVFVVAYDPAQKSTNSNPVGVGVDKGYTGGVVTMTFSINSTGVQVSDGTHTFSASFSKNLNNFSLTTAFSNGAIPALAAANQPNQKVGNAAASFEKIAVSTSLGRGSRKR
jgi:hypothetical protein